MKKEEVDKQVADFKELMKKTEEGEEPVTDSKKTSDGAIIEYVHSLKLMLPSAVLTTVLIHFPLLKLSDHLSKLANAEMKYQCAGCDAILQGKAAWEEHISADCPTTKAIKNEKEFAKAGDGEPDYDVFMHKLTEMVNLFIETVDVPVPGVPIVIWKDKGAGSYVADFHVKPAVQIKPTSQLPPGKAEEAYEFLKKELAKTSDAFWKPLSFDELKMEALVKASLKSALQEVLQESIGSLMNVPPPPVVKAVAPPASPIKSHTWGFDSAQLKPVSEYTPEDVGKLKAAQLALATADLLKDLVAYYTIQGVGHQYKFAKGVLAHFKMSWKGNSEKKLLAWAKKFPGKAKDVTVHWKSGAEQPLSYVAENL